MWQRLTERGRRVISLAQEEAGRLGGSSVSPEHLLLGLVRETDGVAARLLDKMNVSLSAIRADVERQVPRGAGKIGPAMQLTPRASRVIHLAYDEARQLSSNYIGTEHLLLALIREGEGISAKVPLKHRATLERIRQEVEEMQLPEGRRRLDLDASHVIGLAYDEARQLKKNCVETEHLLLALVRQRDSVAVRLLAKMKMSLSEIRSDIERQAPRGAGKPGPDIQITPRARRAIDLANDEVHRLGSYFIGTEHLLLGLIREGEGAAAKVLLKHGATLERTRHEVEEMQRLEGTADLGMQLGSWASFLSRAYDEVKQLKKKSVETEHLLLELARDDEGAAGAILRRHGVELEWTRRQIDAVQQ